jgi:replicative DNA helicase
LAEKNKLPDVAQVLTPEMFYTPEYRFVFEAMMVQYERGE